MTTPIEPSKSEGTYVFDAESGTEMARLMHQDRIITRGIGRLFPEGTDLSNVHDVLDIACGPGGWDLDVAFEYPKIHVVGIDISKTVIDYARAQAWARGMNNAEFKVMDAMKPLEFSDNSFDIVNARLILAFMLPTAWPKLIQESWRILRPGGLICLTECEMGFTNSPALEKLTGMFARALWLAGQSFSPDGRNIGITPMLGRFLQDSDFKDIQLKANALDISAGTEAGYGFYQDFMVIFQTLQPFLIKWKVTTQEEVEAVYQQMLAEVMSNDFRGLWTFLSVWGRKPL